MEEGENELNAATPHHAPPPLHHPLLCLQAECRLLGVAGYLVLFLQETGWFVLGHYRLLQLRVLGKRWEAADAGILPKEKSMKQINPSQAAVTL